MLHGLFIASLVSTVVEGIKDAFTPTIPAENWANKDLQYQDRMNGISEKEIITIIRGKEATDEEVEAVVEFINESYPDIETDVVDGSQDVYSFILSIE